MWGDEKPRVHHKSRLRSDMKSKSRMRINKIATTLEDMATEMCLVDPPLQRPSKEPTVEEKRGRSISPDKPQGVRKRVKTAQDKIKGIPR